MIRGDPASQLPMIKYRTNEKKVLEAILWLTNRRPGMDLYRVLKILFLADKAHFNKYGRPIAGEKYVAMEYGPVAETAYQILRKQEGVRRKLGITDFPFARGTDDQKDALFPAREPELSVFSKSDIAALDDAMNKYGNMSFNGLKALTHRHPAYTEAWAARGSKRSSPMAWEHLLDEEHGDPETIEELEYVSRYAR